MNPLLVATTNPGKIREIRQILTGVPHRLLTLADLAPLREPDETGATFADNARLKAVVYAGATGLPTVAEDSGLAIDALAGRPGVESARYPGATYAEKFRNLYRELAPHAPPRTARFVCALAFVRPPAEAPVFACEGTVDGHIAPEPRGQNGFGYDPIFYFPPYGCTFGEVSEAQKLAVAHRGRAFGTFRAWLMG